MSDTPGPSSERLGVSGWPDHSWVTVDGSASVYPFTSGITNRQIAEPDILVRKFEEFHVREGDGRTLEGLCVPFGVAARVADPPKFEPYDEMFDMGSCSRAEKAPNRVLVDFEHQTSIRDLLGHGIEFAQREDGPEGPGLYGSMRISDNADGDKALQLVRDKILSRLSVMFKPIKSVLRDGVVHRVAVHIDRVALVRQGAYEQAQVLAVRSAPVLPRAEKFNPGLAEDLRHFGINVPGDEDQT